VDDNADATQALQHLLAMLGHDVTVAHDGPGALAAAARIGPQLVLLDIGLPGMDGYALAGKIAQTLGENRPRLVALTGYGARHDRARALDAGFDDHLVKPVDPAHLMRVLDEVMRQT